MFMVRWSRDISDTTISQAHPLFYEAVGTDTRYFTGAISAHLRVASAQHAAVRRQPNESQDDLLSTVDIPRSLYFTEDPHWGAINIVTGVDRRLDRDHSGRLPAGHLFSSRTR